MALQKISDFVTKALTYEADGVSFVFGDLTKGNVFAVNVLANIIFVSALVGALYCLVVIGVVVKLIGVALVPLGSIIVSKILLLETSEEIALREAASTEEVSMDNKGNNPNLISAVSEGDLNGLNMALGIIALVAMVNGVLETFGTSLEQILSYVFAPLGFLQSMIY